MRYKDSSSCLDYPKLVGFLLLYYATTSWNIIQVHYVWIYNLVFRTGFVCNDAAHWKYNLTKEKRNVKKPKLTLSVDVGGSKTLGCVGLWPYL